MNKNIIVSLGIFLVGAVLGFGIGRVGSGGRFGELQRIQAQVEQAKKFFPQTPADIRTISGTVKSVSGSKVTLEIESPNPFEDIPKTRMVTISASTKIILQKQKDPAVLQKELAVFDASVKTLATKPGTPSPAFPSPFQETSGVASDLKPGQSMTITADQNIRDAEAFEAREIRLTPLPAVPASGFPPSQISK